MRVESINHKLRWKGQSIGKPSIIIKIGLTGKEMSLEEVLKYIRQVKACSRVVFAGIDPIIEQLGIIKFIIQLQKGWEIIIETTGGIMPDVNLRDQVTAWEVNIPPEGTKLPFIWNEDAVRFYATQKNATFEWPVTGEIDLVEVKKAVFNFNIPWKRVILTPMIDAVDNLQERFKWLEEFCIEKGSSI